MLAFVEYQIASRYKHTDLNYFFILEVLNFCWIQHLKVSYSKK
jgi:hypothetical protein